MTIRSDVDDIIDWYLQHKPDVKHIAVSCRPDTLRRFAKKKRGGPYVYREFELTAVKKKKEPKAQLSVEMPHE